MRRVLSRLLAIVAGATAITFAVPTSLPAIAQQMSASTCGSWQVVPPAKSMRGPLAGVAAISSRNVWTVGYSIWHWNGLSWRQFQDNGQYVEAIAAVSARDMWAVGGDDMGAGFALHWDGSKWRGATPKGDFDDLNAVGGSVQGTVWAAGTMYAGDGGQSALVAQLAGPPEHTKPLPLPYGETYPYDYRLSGIAVVSSDFAMSVGDGGSDSGNGGAGGIAYVSNGKRWKQVQSPVDALAVAAISKRDAWAVGDGVEHWNGVSWAALPSEAFPADAMLDAVSARSATDVWAAGNHSGRVLIEHWNGARWKDLPGPRVKGASKNLAGMSALRDGDAWAVGSSGTGKHAKPLIERYLHC